MNGARRPETPGPKTARLRWHPDTLLANGTSVHPVRRSTFARMSEGLSETSCLCARVHGHGPARRAPSPRQAPRSPWTRHAIAHAAKGADAPVGKWVSYPVVLLSRVAGTPQQKSEQFSSGP